MWRIYFYHLNLDEAQLHNHIVKRAWKLNPVLYFAFISWINFYRKVFLLFKNIIENPVLRHLYLTIEETTRHWITPLKFFKGTWYTFGKDIELVIIQYWWRWMFFMQPSNTIAIAVVALLEFQSDKLNKIVKKS